MASTLYITVWPAGSSTSALLAHGLAQQSVAHGALIADLAVEGVRLGAAHDVVLLGVLVLHLDGDVGAHRDGVHAQLALVDHADVLDHLLQLGDAVLHQALGVLGFVVLAVLGQVAVAAGFLDLLRQLLAAHRLEVFQFLLHSLEAGSGHYDFLCHGSYLSLSFNYAAKRRLQSLLHRGAGHAARTLWAYPNAPNPRPLLPKRQIRGAPAPCTCAFPAKDPASGPSDTH